MSCGVTDALADIICLICNELFDDPLELSCGHLFCRSCLDTFTSSKIHDEPCRPNHGDTKHLSKEFKGKKYCTTCREFIHIASPNRSRTHLNMSTGSYEISALYSKTHTKEARIVCLVCQFDPPSPAMKTCLDCHLSFCKDCVELRHPMRGVFSGHHMSEPTETPCCPDHGEPFKVFCVTCQRPICYLCDRIGRHRDHAASDLESSFKCSKISLQERADELEIFLEKSKGRIEDLKKRKRDLIAATDTKRTVGKHNFKKILERLKRNNSDLLSHLDQENEQRIKSIDDLTRPLEQDTTLAERFLAQLNGDCLSHAYNLPFLMAISSLSERANNVIRAIQARLEEVSSRDSGEEICSASKDLGPSKVFLRFDIDCATGDAEVGLHFNYDGQEVLFPDFTFDPETAHESVSVKPSGKHLANTKNVFDKRFPGALVTSSFDTGVIYFETVLKYSMKPDTIMDENDLVFCCGVIRGRAADCFYVGKNASSWGIYIYHKDQMKYVCSYDDNVYSDRPVFPDCNIDQTSGTVRLGYLINIQRKQVSIVECTHDRLLYTFNHVDVSSPLTPAVAVYNHHLVEAEVTLITGKDIQDIPRSLLPAKQ